MKLPTHVRHVDRLDVTIRLGRTTYGSMLLALHPLLAALTFAATLTACAEGSPPPPAPQRSTSPAAAGSPRPVEPPEGAAVPPRTQPSATAPAVMRSATAAERARYGWLGGDVQVRSLADAFTPPNGFTRVPLPPTSFGAFLRGLPLRAPGTPVRTYEGDVLLEGRDPRVAAVIELDVGTRDLQQCADTAIRLHAEWLWSRGEEDAIGYHFTSGDLATWSRHKAGDRPVIGERSVSWKRSAGPVEGHGAFRTWLDLVFSYAGTVSLAREAAPIGQRDLRPGDAFVLPGGPGHTVVVLDVAVDAEGHRLGLLGQGYMPAQDAHVLSERRGGAWFDLDADAVDTPFWPVPFPWSSLRRMRTASGATE